MTEGVDTNGGATLFFMRRGAQFPEVPMDQVNGVVTYLLANPIFLIPILLMVAMMAYALLKKLLKMAAVVAIAGALYVLLVEYFGAGI